MEINGKICVVTLEKNSAFYDSLGAQNYTAMEVSDEDLKEFRKIYRKEHGKKLSIAESREMAERLVSLYVLLMRPLPNKRDVRAPSGDQLADQQTRQIAQREV